MRRSVVTGMAVATPIGHRADELLDAMCAGRSAIGPWRSIDVANVALKIGGDLGHHRPEQRAESLWPALPPKASRGLRRMMRTLPWSMRLGVVLALEAWRSAGLWDQIAVSPERVTVIAAGHVINSRYINQTGDDFRRLADSIDALYALHSLDSIHASAVAELLDAQGGVYSMGSACASGLHALRAGMMEIATDQADIVVIHAPVAEISPVELQSMVMMGAVSLAHADAPHQASRPFDRGRSGFVPAHGGATLILEAESYARARGRTPLARVLSVAIASDACHLPLPNADGEARAIVGALARAGITPAEVDFISAHATSTPVGDIVEINALRAVLGDRLAEVPINAPKSMLGHCLWSAPLVELVVAIEQMRTGRLHPTANLDDVDPAAADLDLCVGAPRAHNIRYLLKNSFGFGGTNAACVLAAAND